MNSISVCYNWFDRETYWYVLAFYYRANGGFSFQWFSRNLNIFQVLQAHYYRPQPSLRQGNGFTPVCDSVHGGGWFSVQRGLCPGGPLSRGGLYQGDPPPLYSNVRVVRILLECTIVIIIISGNSRCSPLLLHTNFTTDLLSILGLCTVSVHWRRKNDGCNILLSSFPRINRSSQFDLYYNVANAEWTEIAKSNVWSGTW